MNYGIREFLTLFFLLLFQVTAPTETGEKLRHLHLSGIKYHVLQHNQEQNSTNRHQKYLNHNNIYIYPKFVDTINL